MTDIRAALGAHRRSTPCEHCGAERPPHERTCPKAQRARSSRDKGGRWELEVTRLMESAFPGARKVGPLGGPDDVLAGPLYIQAKKEARVYPKALDNLLTSLERHITADQFPLLALAHPGHEKRHKLIVMDARDFVTLIRVIQGGVRSIPVALTPDQWDRIEKGERP